VIFYTYAMNGNPQFMSKADCNLHRSLDC